MINRFALSFLYIELDRTRNVRGHACLYTTYMEMEWDFDRRNFKYKLASALFKINSMAYNA